MEKEKASRARSSRDQQDVCLSLTPLYEGAVASGLESGPGGQPSLGSASASASAVASAHASASAGAGSSTVAIEVGSVQGDGDGSSGRAPARAGELVPRRHEQGPSALGAMAAAPGQALFPLPPRLDLGLLPRRQGSAPLGSPAGCQLVQSPGQAQQGTVAVRSPGLDPIADVCRAGGERSGPGGAASELSTGPSPGPKGQPAILSHAMSRRLREVMVSSAFAAAGSMADPHVAAAAATAPDAANAARGMGPASGPGRRRPGAAFEPLVDAAAAAASSDAGTGNATPGPFDSVPLRGTFAASTAGAGVTARENGCIVDEGDGDAVAFADASAGGGGISIDRSDLAGAIGEIGVSGQLDPRWLVAQRPSLPTSKSGEAVTLTDGSHNSWVDTMTMWSAVHRNGQELQRRRLAAGSGGAPFCAGVAFGAAPRRFIQRVRTQLVVMARVIVKDPTTIAVPVFLLVCLLAFGLWGVFSVSYAIRDGRVQAARNAATDFSNTLRSHITATMAPASTVKTLIELDPWWPSINATFHSVAPGLIQKGLATDAILTIVLAPQGIVSAIVPTGLPAWSQVYGLDLLQNKSWRGDALKTVVLHEQGMVMTGPSRLRAGMMGIVTRYAVFIDGAGPDETFGATGTAFNCSPCYVQPTPTSAGSRFWGFAQLNVDWEMLIRNTTHMYDLCERDGLNFNMTYIDPVTFVNRSIASCGTIKDSPVSVNISVMHNSWNLVVADARGWMPDWLPWVVLVVVLVSLWVAGAMAVIMINRREHMWLLQAMLPKKVIAALRRGEDYAEAFECVTVLFSDIVSYTTIASAMEPIKVVRLLNEMYSEFDALVDQFECYKVETIGDAFMAVCGTQGEDPVAAAVKMARLATAMIERTRVLVSADGQKIQIRIGEGRKRACLFAGRGDVTAQLLLQDPCSGFRIVARGPIEIKGKGQMLTHWLVPSHEERCSGGNGHSDGGGGRNSAADTVAFSGGFAGGGGDESQRDRTSAVVAVGSGGGTGQQAGSVSLSADGMLLELGRGRPGGGKAGGGGGGDSGRGSGTPLGSGSVWRMWRGGDQAGAGGGAAAGAPAGGGDGRIFSGPGVPSGSGARSVGASSTNSGALGKIRHTSVDLRLFQYGGSRNKTRRVSETLPPNYGPSSGAGGGKLYS
ncbi:hypothetical protein GPECTOR_29g131 [Gonium pectorale]|uniref:Guanylate cyclase domain-containing protein n=1 Tax=Gonium pectorale TaxID=33097 RepID=A0A150GEF0_GONPE|nr:hypothetical protein GPECTOR_29g131 [Gonium pectorale]|eukprot:KXZ48227.1 hypothetical protein GPECTOR_29g131 [Gonium pectorale]